MKKMALVLGLLCLASVCLASVSRADQIYAVNGSLTIVGNDACAGLCVETLNFSFDLDEYDMIDYYVSIVPGSASVTSLGPLGTFGPPDGPFGPYSYGGNPNSNYIEFFTTAPVEFPSPPGQSPPEIDIWLAEDGVSETPFVPQIAGADLFSCGFFPPTQSCVTDFCPPSQECGTPERLYLIGAVESVVTPISTPEPGTLPLLGIAFLALLFLRVRSKVTRPTITRATRPIR
jgi:hypothetical protein